jgi:hypothetical protein
MLFRVLGLTPSAPRAWARATSNGAGWNVVSARDGPLRLGVSSCDRCPIRLLHHAIIRASASYPSLLRSERACPAIQSRTGRAWPGESAVAQKRRVSHDASAARQTGTRLGSSPRSGPGIGHKRIGRRPVTGTKRRAGAGRQGDNVTRNCEAFLMPPARPAERSA